MINSTDAVEKARTIESLLKLQRRFMDVLGVKRNEDIHPESLLQSPELLNAVTGLVAESVEVLGAMNDRSRPWVESLDATAARNNVVEETIDTLFYLLEVINLLGLSGEDVVHQYARKFTINMARIISKQPVDVRRELIQAAYDKNIEFDDPHEPGTKQEEAALCIVSMIDKVLGYPSMRSYIEPLVIDPIAFVRRLFDDQRTRATVHQL